MNKGLTMSLVFEAESANYGEGYGNIAILKKLTRGDGNSYSYISRQALRYNIVEQMGYNNTPVVIKGKAEKTGIQFHPDATIEEYPEIDLFGYMKTNEGKGADTRNAVVRLSNAISLETYNSDLEFLTNMGLSKREKFDNSNIVQSEIHKSYYAYTIVVDLDKIGIDNEINLPKEEKIKRISELLKTIQYLYRDIKGRRENLSPVFAIGGIYERKNPFFENRIKIENNKLDIEMLKEIIESDNSVKNVTEIGYIKNTFKNNAEIEEKLAPNTIGEFFNKIIKEVEEEF